IISGYLPLMFSGLTCRAYAARRHWRWRDGSTDGIGDVGIVREPAADRAGAIHADADGVAGRASGGSVTQWQFSRADAAFGIDIECGGLDVARVIPLLTGFGRGGQIPRQ